MPYYIFNGLISCIFVLTITTTTTTTTTTTAAATTTMTTMTTMTTATTTTTTTITTTTITDAAYVTVHASVIVAGVIIITTNISLLFHESNIMLYCITCFHYITFLPNDHINRTSPLAITCEQTRLF